MKVKHGDGSQRAGAQLHLDAVVVIVVVVGVVVDGTVY